MKTGKIILLIVFLFLASCASFGATWQETLTLTDKNNEQIKSAVKQAESYEWSYRKSFSSFLPQLSASAGMTRSGTSDSYSYGLSATQSIFSGFENIFNMQAAYAQYCYQRESAQNTRATAYYNVRSAFVSTAIASENIKIQEAILKRRKENSRLIQLRFESGRENHGNLLRTQADVLQAEYDLTAAKRSLELARLNLSQLVGEEIKEVAAPDKVMEPALPQTETLLPVSPAYLMSKYQLESAEISQRATLSEFLPTLSLSGNYKKSGSSWPPASRSDSWSLNFSYSFFPGGSNFADRIIYGLKLDQAKEDFKKSEKDLRYNIEDAAVNYKNAAQALLVKAAYLKAAEERAKIARTKYVAGLMSYEDWDRIENELVSSEKDNLSQKSRALLAEAAWYKSYGGWIK
ncbi:hypothetical protein A2276_03040 [candidate division WOR-1 bacterium RIFOXYA12_FULL_43_27]|uniref:Transporter n=1 Tax=candidate division WOR-1 bacterium RIFOXYC2_FULL_46_14 TaxID=1802587 RepID=A0A1F4U7L4_UNCSA|nr:MAG: hypothetical protein A2276_03040 [candidate division WOR-1 bacterium RIFOXYA12_FULL_43_27]OGC19321.1 MAG: hypothetical protein A2292_01295 [candidate division WOR-1 bacterium RIFOXYB2_FULL_46_45]OGC30310.1 MAG: hypothetical protein A2232_01295 [candidate division WOR-1 bacterium RIFOXYA2_FULL_46_56]OGC40911.1 MAG: hypothetical protein A2438_01295 [candidate division WOR-1 bacterium RIFOXYC2_FULL_46_14]